MTAKKLGFGFMRLPLTDPSDQKSINYDELENMVDEFIKKGFTYFDTAYMYHDFISEKAIKKVLVDRYDRKAYTLATKMPTMFLKKREDLERIFSEQLEKTGVSYFDYYLLHNLGVENYEIAEELDAFDFIAKKKAEGRIVKTGFSYHDSAALLDKILTKHPEIDFVQLQINYLDWDSEGIKSGKCYEVCVKHKKPVVVMEPVKGGALARIPKGAENILKAFAPEASAASWAIRFSASLENVMVVLSGMSDMAQLKDNTSYMENFIPLSGEEREVIKKAVEEIKSSIAVPCTACRYCTNGCPMNIPIPDYFDLYNSEKQFGGKGFSVHVAYYDSLTKEHGKASDCIACGQCESHCPQHIAIIDELKNVAALMER